MHHHQGGVKSDLRAEIPVRHSVQAVLAHLGKAQQFGGQLPVQRIGGTRQSTASQRHHVHALQGVIQTGQVTEKHFSIGHQVMSKGDGLRTLHMSISRHDGGAVLLCLLAKDLHELLQLRFYSSAVLPQSQPHIQGHLIVPAAGGMKPLSRVADAGGELSFHKGMDIFRVRIDGQRSGIQIVPDAL